MVLDHEDSPGMVGVKRRQQTPRKSPRKSPRRSASLRGNENVNGNATRIEAQNRVLAELRNLKAALVEAGDSVSYLNAETKELDGKMRGLEKAAGQIAISRGVCRYPG